MDTQQLQSIGRVWRPIDRKRTRTIIEHEQLRQLVEDVQRGLTADAPRSALLVGEPGVGKSAVRAVVGARLMALNWTIFEAGAAELLAGNMFIGQLEERLRLLLEATAGKRVLWLVTEFHELLWAGRHLQNPTGILEVLLPHIEAGALRVLGEVHPEAYQALLQQLPKLATAVEAHRIPPLGERDTMEVIRAWATREFGAASLEPQLLNESAHLAQQFLPHRATPGRVLHLLVSATERVRRQSASAVPGRADVLEALAQQTGLPRIVLDDREPLDAAELRRFFAGRVLGQPEAVSCLVERIAMIKAGLTDPTRPLGVFLFVGPTGTGKTEIAKATAEYLFGSRDRLIRLDMTELQTPESTARLVGADAGDPRGGDALTTRVRTQPFSVVLLDEFEKAHPAVWDIFLQVFDDGRLTDRGGNTADFRHAIVIMTSNLGSTVARAPGIGFQSQTASFDPGDAERSVADAFRPEFLNRLDRVVVFRPLGRAIMRDLLQKELQNVLSRRGFRSRGWALEWDEAAIDFLLEQGFSATLGARPLKRAIERHLLAPLALSIVGKDAPRGEQFLLVRGEAERLVVEFVDFSTAEEHPEVAAEPPPGLLLADVVLEPRGTAAEIALLERAYESLAQVVATPAWDAQKSAAMTRMSEPGFWESPERFGVLGTVEYMDRIEVGYDTAGSLLRRVDSAVRDGAAPPRELVRRFAQQLWLVARACAGLQAGEPRDAFIRVRAAPDPAGSGEGANAFARRVADMYRRWAEKRRMKLHTVSERDDSGAPYEVLFAVSGFAAYALLASESGQHVLEIPGPDRALRRVRATVHVAAQPVEPPGRGRGSLRQQAEAALAAAQDRRSVVVRRYRDTPAPLVTDRVRGWRTGRLDRVLDGDFDVLR